jgi:hypothetical protein
MMQKTLIKAAIGVAAAAALLGALSAQAQTATVKPPATGEANDHTSPNATVQPPGKARNATGNVNPGVVPPMVGEANDPSSPNADPRPAAKIKPAKKMKKAKAKPPVTGEANDHSENGGTTEAAKAAKAAKQSGT